MRTYPTIALTEDQRIFLRGYAPKSRHFTSQEEMQLIYAMLNIAEHLHELTALRNTVVQFYDECIGDGSDRDLTYEFMNSMMSVTAVIDNCIYKY